MAAPAMLVLLRVAAAVAAAPEAIRLTMSPGDLDAAMSAVRSSRPDHSADHALVSALHSPRTAGASRALERLRLDSTSLEGIQPPSSVVESIQRLRAAAEEVIAEADRALQSLGVAVTVGGSQATVARLERLDLPMNGPAGQQQAELTSSGQSSTGQSGQGGDHHGANPLESQALQYSGGYSQFQPFPQPWNCDCYHCGKDTPVDTELAVHPEYTNEGHDQCQPLCSVGEVCGPETGPNHGGCYTRASAPCNCATRTVVFVEQASCDCYSCGSDVPDDTYYSSHANMTNGNSDHCEPLCLVGPTCSATKGTLVDGCYTKALSPCDCKHKKTIMT